METPETVELEAARAQCARRAWAQAFDALRAADRATGLCAEDLERLALSAYLTGRDDDYLDALDRAYQAHLRAGESLRGVRCAFWIGLRLLFRGDTGRASGWLGRAARLADAEERECVERGYLMLPTAEQSLHAGDSDCAYATATAAVEIAQRFDDPDLLTCALHLQGRVMLRQGHVARGLARLDEAMIAVTAGNLSPIVTGLMYCSVIDACQRVFAAGRAREWTFAMSRWCEEQSEMVAFTGVCFAHRAQIMRLHGSWHEALAQTRRAWERRNQGAARSAVAEASYEAGEIHRLRGDFAEAETAYRNANRHGREPQPGLALLRLAQGRMPVAAAAIRRATGTAADVLERIRLLPAYVDKLRCPRMLREFVLNRIPFADQNHLDAEILRRQQHSVDHNGRGTVPAHRIDGDPRHGLWKAV